jgi:hypothetical protein
VARTEDSGNCTFIDQQWRTTSTVTGQSNMGTYRVVDARDIAVMGPDGSAVWQRR